MLKPPRVDFNSQTVTWKASVKNQIEYKLSPLTTIEKEDSSLAALLWGMNSRQLQELISFRIAVGEPEEFVQTGYILAIMFLNELVLRGCTVDTACFVLGKELEFTFVPSRQNQHFENQHCHRSMSLICWALTTTGSSICWSWCFNFSSASLRVLISLRTTSLDTSALTWEVAHGKFW